MSYTAGYNFDVSNLDSSFYKKYSAGTPIPDPFEGITLSESTTANFQIQNALNRLNDQFIDDSVRIVLKFGGISASTGDAGATATYHQFSAPVLIDHPVSDRLLIEGVPPSDHSILGVSYYDAVGYTGLGISGDKYTGLTAADAGYYAQFVISNGNSLRIGEYLAVYDNRHQKYLNPSFYQFRDTVNGRVFATPYPVTAEKLRASLIVGVHKIVDKIDLDESRIAGITINPINKVDYVTVHIKGYNPTYSVGLGDYGSTFARRALLTPQGVIGRYEQGYGSSTVLTDPLFFSGLSSGDTGASAPGYRASEDFRYGATGSTPRTGFSAVPKNRQGITGMYLKGGTAVGVGDEWETYDRLAQTSGHSGLNLSIRNYRDSNDFRAKGFKSIIECDGDGFIITNNSKPPEIKNILLLSKSGATGTHGIRVDNSSSVNLHQVAVVGFERGAGVFANNKSTVNCISDKFSDPEVFREVGVFSSGNYTGYEARNGSNINAPRSVGAGSVFANFYAAENSYINAYAATSTSCKRYGVAATGKSFVNADSALSCLNGSDGFFCSNGSLLTINSGRACYNYGNGIHAFSSGEIRSFDVIASSNKKDGIVANDMSMIVCGDSSKEPINWDLYYGYDAPYYNFENPTNISQSTYNGISGLASSTDSFINASFFETYDNSRLGGEFGRLKDVDCVVANVTGYCYGGSSAGTTCDAAYRYCNNAVYSPSNFSGGNTNDVLDALAPTNTSTASLCIPYSNFAGVTAQVPVSKNRYTTIINGLSAEYGGSSGLTIGKILACKGYLPGCGLRFTGANSSPGAVGGTDVSICDPGNTPGQILAGATGTASQSFVINSNLIACTADTESLTLNVVCVSTETAYTSPPRPLSLLLPNYDVEIRDSSKIAFAGRIANFGYYDPRSGVRIQPLYQGSNETNSLLKPSTLIGYAGNRNGSELVVTDQTALQASVQFLDSMGAAGGGMFGNQAVNSLDPRYSKYTVRYSSDDFLAAADLYDPVPQVGFVNQTPYVLNLGNRDPDTGALLSSIGTTAGQIAVANSSSTPPLSLGTNDQSSGPGYPTY